MANKCKECGCVCNKCISSDHDVQLHIEIENLKQQLVERENHIVTMETNFLNEANKFPSGELVALREQVFTWEDKYRRLHEAYRRVQRVNQGLEDKLLKLVDVCETDKTTLTKDVATLSHKLAEANYAIKKLTDDNERYKKDVSLAIQFLQCKQSNFVQHKFDSLPPEVQSQVSQYMTIKRKPEERRVTPEMTNIKVMVPTFPPTAMVYSVPKSPNPVRKIEEDVEAPSVDIVSAAIMAKVLEERQRERATAKHCDSCTCAKSLMILHSSHHTIGTQTEDFNDICQKCFDFPKIPTVSPIEPPINTANNTELKSKTSNNSSSLIDLTSDSYQTSPKNDLSNPNVHVIQGELTYQEVTFYNVNEKGTPKIQNKTMKHHRLCDKSSHNLELESLTDEKADLEKNIDKISAKNSSYGSLKGPRYCSIRLQTDTKNVILDDTLNKVQPVEYKRNHHRVNKNIESVKMHESCESNSSNGMNLSQMSDNSTQNQKRVADWIQSNIENEISSSDNSRCDSVNKNVNLNKDKEKYAEMEENVKRFLFGESEFKKTVEIGKLKYQSFQGEPTGDSNQTQPAQHGVVIHTETDI